jgi:hypothetical protein
MINRINCSPSSSYATFKYQVVLNIPFAITAIIIWLAAFLGSPSIAQSVAKEGGTNARGSDVSRITATPERVRVGDGSASTDIAWNTGDGSPGFVFVAANGRPPVFVAKGKEGSRVFPGIHRGTYVFGLYQDAERRTMLATVTVIGVAKVGSSKQTSSWQLRWLLTIALIAVSYVAVYLSSTGPVRTTFPLEPTTSPRRLHVARNLLLAIAAFICVDGLLFHTPLYSLILAPDSYAGRIAMLTRAEKNRAPSGLKEVLVLGDSRIAEGFSAAVADKLSSVDGFKFVNLAEPASAVNMWEYMLREVDPTRRRYWAIVVPYGIGYEPNSADHLRISMAAPLLRYSDCVRFASAFRRWSGRFRAFTACILRGSAFQSDVVDFLAHPIARIKSVETEPTRLQSRDLYKGREYDLVGISYDPQTGKVSFPSRLTEAQREAVRDSLVKPSQSEIQDFLKMQRDGIQRILNRYSTSPTEIVLTPVPRGPFAGLPGASTTFPAAFPRITTQKSVFCVPEQTFDFLEKPEFYFDGYHLNARGRQRFTETLVAELVGRLRSADSDPGIRYNSKLSAEYLVLSSYGREIAVPAWSRLSKKAMDQSN